VHRKTDRKWREGEELTEERMPMITKEQYREAVDYASDMFRGAGIAITPQEKESIEVADFGLGILEDVGLQLLVYVNTERCCAKEMVLRPFQTCPEHRHANGIENGVSYVGKEETFRVRRGTCYLYVDGEGRKEDIKAKIPPTPVTVFREIVLHEGEQYTLHPDTNHWFQAGDEGAVISEFSTKSRDDSDLFTDERIKRIPEVEEI
jgi:D-lyxose ketol-isomerase